MGIIQKQAIRGTVFSYIGVLLGFVTTALLYPFILTTDEIGLLKLLVSFSVIFSQFGSLGFINVINRLFPWFRDSDSRNKGFIFLGMVIALVGFIITTIVFFALRPIFIENNLEKSALFVKYLNLIIPLTFFTIAFNLFDGYNKVLYDTVLGTFLKEVLQRVLILISLLLFHFGMYSLQGFVWLYVICLATPSIILFIILGLRGEIRFSLENGVYSKKVLKEMLVISSFGLISGFSTLAALNIDSILVNKFLGLSETGIYTIAFFFGTLVLIPSRPLNKISTTIIADSWKEGNLENIKMVYYKSCINQAVISLFIFLCIWLNIDNVFKILPTEFEAGRYVIFFIGLANILEMSSGVNGIIIVTSKYYRIHTLFIVIFLIALIVFNFIFIPLYGLTGAAIATTLSTLIFNFLRFSFLYQKFRMNPFSFRFLIIILVALVSYGITSLIPAFESYVMDILMRSIIAMIIYGSLSYFLKLSEDLNSVAKELIKKIFG